MNQICHHFINTIKSKSHKFQEMRKRIDVPQEKREAIYHELLSLSKEDILPRGAISRASKKHDFSPQTIKRIWDKGLEPNKRSNTGRLSSDENNPTDDSDDTDIVEEGIVLASV